MSSQKLDEKREALFAAAERFTTGGKSVDQQRALCDAATEYAKERQAHFRPQQNKEASSFKVPFGRSQGTPIGEATTDDLNWVLPKLKEKLDDPAKARYRAQDEKLIAAIERELETR